MKERDDKRGGLGCAIAGMVLLPPVLYVLSIGPFTWLLTHGVISLPPWAETFYWPITWACEESDPIRQLFRWYQGLI